MFKKILLGYDGSEPAKKAFERCLEMARCFGARLAIVTIVQPPEFAEDVETEAIIENARPGNKHSGVSARIFARVPSCPEPVCRLMWKPD